MAETLYELETSLSGQEQFVAEGVSELAGEMVRWSVGPALDIDRNLLAKNPGRALSQVPVEDANLRFTREELVKPSEETVSLAVPLALAKAQAVEREFHLTPKEKSVLATFKTKVRKAALGLATFSLVASACTSEAKPNVSPTPFNTEPVSTEVSPTQTPTTEPTPEILATATETFTPFTPPVNPPEFTPGGAGGEFPEGVREQAEIDRYRALLVLARQEGRTIFGATDEEVKQQLNAFAEETNIEVKQEWNGKFGDEYQLVSVNVRTNPDGAQSVFWFATPGGALSARPDVPSEEDSTLIEVPIEFWYFPEFRWGDDKNIYMYKVPGGTNFTFAQSWFNTTRANYLTDGGLESAWELTSLSEQEIAFLAEKLRCDGACIYDANWGIPGHSFGIDIVSTGRFETIEVKDSTGRAVGHVDALVAITKDSMENPRLVYLTVQATTVDNPNLNLFRVGVTMAAIDAGLHQVPDPLNLTDGDLISEPQPVEFLQKIFQYGAVSRNIVPTDLSLEPADSWTIGIMRPVFSNPDYAERIKEFGAKRGNVENYDEPILLFPS